MIVPATFAAFGFTMLVAHHVADHWVQTHYQATHKGQRGDQAATAVGRRACLAHVTTYTATTSALGLVAWLALDLAITPAGFLAGQLVSAATHYWADRRFTLAWLARLVGKGEFYALGMPRADHDDNPTIGTGAYALDTSWHWLWLFVASLITATA